MYKRKIIWSWLMIFSIPIFVLLRYLNGLIFYLLEDRLHLEISTLVNIIRTFLSWLFGIGILVGIFLTIIGIIRISTIKKTHHEK